MFSKAINNYAIKNYRHYLILFSYIIILLIIYAINVATASGLEGRAFDAPSLVRPDSGETIGNEEESPGGIYRVESGETAVNVYRNSDDSLLLSIGSTGEVFWGFSPDDHRFVLHGGNNQHSVKLYNLEETEYNDPPIWQGTWTVDWSNVSFSKDGKYLMYVRNWNTDYHFSIIESVTGSVKVEKSILNSSPSLWGFSPNEDRFTVAWLSDGIHYIQLYNLDHYSLNNKVWDNTMISAGSSSIGFSRNGKYLLYVVQTGVNTLNMWAIDTLTGNERYSNTFNYYSSEHGVDLEGEEFGVATWGFSRDSEDNVFIYAYIDVSRNVTWRPVNMATGEYIIEESALNTNSSFWRVCRHGDAVGIVTGAPNNKMIVRLLRVSSGNIIYNLENDTMNIADVQFRTTDDWYIAYIDNVRFNLAPRYTDDDEPPTWPDDSELEISELGQKSFVVSWPEAIDNRGVTGYRVFLNNVEVASLGSDIFTFSFAELSPETTYQVGVEARDEAGNWSARLVREVMTKPLLPPTWPDDSQFSITLMESCPPYDLLLEWSPALDEEGVSEYRVYLDGSVIDTVPADGDSQHLALIVKGFEIGLELGQIYSFKIEAGNSAGKWSEDGPEQEIEIYYLPPPCWPSGAVLDLTSIGYSSVTLNWPEVIQNQYVAEYIIYRNYSPFPMGSIDPNIFSPDEGQFSFDINGLWPGTEYFFRVKAKDFEGNYSAYLDSQLITTKELVDAGPPEWPDHSKLSASEISSTWIKLQWTEAKDEVGFYQIFLEDTRIITIPGSEVNYTITGLNPGKSYHFTVQAGDNWNNWTDDGPSFIVTTNDEPQVPEIVSVYEKIGSWPRPCLEDFWHGTDGKPVISEDGQYIAFASREYDLIPGQGNGYRQIYVYNRQQGNLYLASISSDGEPGDGDSTDPSISADGRFISFESEATNLDSSVDAPFSGIYLHDIEEEYTKLISLDNYGIPLQSVGTRHGTSTMSADGQSIIYDGDRDEDGLIQNWVWLYDHAVGISEPLNILASGQCLTFLRSPAISADGHFVSYITYSDDTSDLWIYDRLSGRKEIVFSAPRFSSLYSITGLSLSSDGSLLIYEDIRSLDDINLFVYDTQTGTLEPVSVASTTKWTHDNSTGVPVISADGRNIVYSSNDYSIDSCVDYNQGLPVGRGDLSNIYIYDRWEKDFEWVSFFAPQYGSRGTYNPGSVVPSISGDGKIVTFHSIRWDYDLEDYYYKIYVYERGNTDIRPPCWFYDELLEDSLEITSLGIDHVTVQWSEAIDNVAVTAYRFYKDDELVVELPEDKLTYTITGLNPETEYKLKVEAGDAAGNWTNNGPSAIVTTLSESKYFIYARAEPDEGGVVTGSGIYDQEEIVNLKAYNNEGFMFSSWTEDGVVVHNETNYTFIAETNRSLIANFIEVNGEPNNDPDLSTLLFSTGTLIPDFDPGITIYNVSVSYEVETIELIATLSDENAVMTINGEPATSGEAKTVTLDEPGTATVIIIEVTAEDGIIQKAYTVTVNRAESPLEPTWKNLTTADAQVLAYDGGVLAASVEGFGIGIYDGNDWVNLTTATALALATDGNSLAASVESFGTWIYDGEWSQLTPATADLLAVDNGMIAASFVDHGIWLFDGNDWANLTPASARALAFDSGRLVASVDGFGTWLNDGEWQQITTETAQVLALSGNELVASFGDHGIWHYDGLTWQQLIPATARALAIDNGVIAASVDGFGTWLNAGEWQQLTEFTAQHLGLDSGSMAVSFEELGVWLYD